MGLLIVIAFIVQFVGMICGLGAILAIGVAFGQWVLNNTEASGVTYHVLGLVLWVISISFIGFYFSSGNPEVPILGGIGILLVMGGIGAVIDLMAIALIYHGIIQPGRHLSFINSVKNPSRLTSMIVPFVQRMKKLGHKVRQKLVLFSQKAHSVVYTDLRSGASLVKELFGI